MARAIPTRLRPALEAYASRLRAAFGERLREVRLFGSFARGDANEDSDIDVLVLIDGLTDREIGDVAELAGYVALETGLPLSALPMPTERLERLRAGERALAAALDTEGIPVRRHAALTGLLGQHFVLSGVLTAADVAAVSRIGGFRELADYERTWNATLELVDEAFGVALPLTDRVNAILAKGGWTKA